MRVLHAPTNIANQAWSAAQGLRAMGHHAEVWHYGANPFSFPVDRLIDDPGDPEAIIRVLREALDANFDVFHFHFARSLVPARGALPWFWDLPLLRGLDKRIVFTFHGTDVRLRSRHVEEDPWSYYRFSDVPCDEDLIRARLDVIRGYADHLIVTNPLNRMFVPEAVYVPKAVDLGSFEPIGAVREHRPLVVHVPSRRATKGTEFVLRGIEDLQRRGVPFEFRLAESLSHDKLIALFADADVVVDNLLLGDCEVSALEAMALAKPVVTRVRDEVLEHHPDLPAVDADPDTFVERLEPVLADAAMRAELGARGRRYVESTHAVEEVARRLVSLYERAGKGTRVTFPGWSAPSRPARLAQLEERIRTLEVRTGAQKRALEGRDEAIASLRAELERLRSPLRVRLRRILAPLARAVPARLRRRF